MVLKKNIMERNNKKKRRKILNIILGGGSILAMLGAIIYVQITINKDADRFYKNSISSIITDKGTDWLTGRANVFYLSDGLKIFLAFNKVSQLSVGDSIYKESDTYIYDVYKKNHKGQYEHSGTYDYRKVHSD
ncbi:hypothetical protein CDL10_07050 [Avrilella dinanensis]|uniref:Uncharacterized protein n=2 Tax=Avrilella dinanensis TaxID=2008672 RepID=A0A2M9R624_9FLAO|nr:hypothetical protein CDL10_07050 [Avrilella dinanensis]